MPRTYIYYFCCLVLFVCPAQAQTVRLQVEGLSGDLRKNVRARLLTISSHEISADESSRTRVKKAIAEGLRSLGYYQPMIDFEFRPARSFLCRPMLIAKVTAGEAIKIANTTIILRGNARYDKDYQQLIHDSKSVIGAVLNHGKYDIFKERFNRLALHKGYFDGDFRKSELAVSVDHHQAFWNIDYDSGQRYRFGKVDFQGSQISEAYLQALVPFKKGENYNSQELTELNRRLAATGWFKSVVVAPEFEKSHTNKILALTADVSPSAKNSIETGLGYATDIGPRMKATWKRPWVNTRGQSLSTSINLSAPEKHLDISYKIPLKTNLIEESYTLQGEVKRSNFSDIRSSSTSTLAISRHWNNSKGWQKVLHFRWSFTQEDVTKSTMLIYPGVSISRTRSRGGLMPTSGNSQRYSLDVSDTLWGSDIAFATVKAQNVWIHTLADKHRFIARTTLGWIETKDFTNVPFDLRFFAGGDRSIRGYKYQSISPRNSEGKLMGASKQATGSLEYQYNIYNKWWGALFVDAGEAVNDIKHSNFKNGVGFGVRWQSPIGPIKLDIARPIGDEKEHGVQFYIGLGPEL